MHQCRATAGDDALGDRCLGGGDGVLDAVLAFLGLGLGGGTDLDDGDAAGQLGQPLLQLLAIPVRVGLVDLGLDLCDAVCDGRLGPATVDDGGAVLGHRDPTHRTQHLEADVLQP